MISRDLRYAVRSLARAPGFAIAVILTLGLGIGANTAIFSVVQGVLLKPLPHREGNRLIYLRQSMNGPGGENIDFSVPEIDDFRKDAHSFGGIAEYSPIQLTMERPAGSVRLQVGLVTGNYFNVMGLSQVAGRLLNSGDDGTKVPPVAVLTYEYWQKAFGGDKSIIGKSVRLGGRQVEIVGVVEPAPTFPAKYDVLMNMVISEHHTSALMQNGRTHRMTEMVARLAPGATLDQARSEVRTIRARVQKEFVESYDPGSQYKVTVIPFQEVLGEKARLTLWLLMGAAAFVMIISCANVANLTLMRGVRREHELVVRAALGAGTGRLRRLLLAENLILAGAGALLGLVIAVGGLKLLVSLAERYSPRANEIRLDGTVLAFTAALSVVIALILSFAPTLAKEGTLGAWIASGVSRMSGSLRRQRLQRGLVVAQIAVSVVLLTGAGLLTRTMIRLSEVSTGLTGNVDNVLTMEVPFDYTNRKDADTKALFDRMRREISALPGVKEAAIGSTMPLRESQFALDIKGEGRVLAAGEPMPHAEWRFVSPEYFSAAGVPLLAGRGFADTDRQGTESVVILNKSMADKLFPNGNAVGRKVAWTGAVLQFIGMKEDAWRTVVGVVGDTKDGGPDAPVNPVVFSPFAQEATFAGGLVVRSDRDPTSLVSSVTRVVRGIVPLDPIENVMTIAQIRDQSVAPRRLNAVLVSSFGILAVIIAAVGIAGVLAFSVSARTNEIGIRMSLGADSARVQRMVIAEGGSLLVIGLVSGVLVSFFATRLMRGLLFGVAPNDPATLVLVAIGMGLVGLVACWVPAIKAAKISPAIAMRGQ